MKKTFSRITKKIRGKIKNSIATDIAANVFYGRVKKTKNMIEANKDADSLKYRRNQIKDRNAWETRTDRKTIDTSTDIPPEFQGNAENRAEALKKGKKKIGAEGNINTYIPNYKESYMGRSKIPKKGLK